MDPAGKEAVIVGRSNLVGRPLFSLLLGANATVTVCHSRTRDLGEVCRRAEILVAAAGQPRLVTGDMIRPGATVIDVGTNRTDDGLVGDVDFEAAREVAGAITPVPGGVGPMTIAMLLANTVQAARARRGGGVHIRLRRSRVRRRCQTLDRGGRGMGRLSQGQMIAAVGGDRLLVAMFLPWIGVSGPSLPSGGPYHGGVRHEHLGEHLEGLDLDIYLLITGVVALLPALLALTDSAEEFSFVSAATFLLGVVAVILVMPS